MLLSPILIFLCIPVSAVFTAAVNPNGIKMLLANDLSTFFIKGKTVFSYVPISLPRNPPDFQRIFRQLDF